MTNAEFLKLTEADLSKKVIELKEELLNLRFQHAINQLDNPMRLSLVRKDIARVKTVIRQREISAAKE